MNPVIRNAALALGLTFVVAPIAFAGPRPPPPTNTPYEKYGLSAGCKYEGIDPGTTAGPDAYTGRSAWVNTEKFLIPCGGK